MKDWFKVFGLSFFSDKSAERAPQYGFVSIVLSIMLSVLFFMFGFMDYSKKKELLLFPRSIKSLFATRFRMPI